MSAMNPLEVMASSRVCPLEEFGAAFEGFRLEAFRLECLPTYSVDEERDALSLFRRKQPRPASLNSEWLEILDSVRKRNAIVRRIRLLPQIPSEYIHFEYEWGYRVSALHGEEIRGLRVTEDLIAKFPVLIDFWLFDSRTAFLMLYDFAGRFLGVLQVNDSDVPAFVAQAQQLLAASDDLSQIERYLEGE